MHERLDYSTKPYITIVGGVCRAGKDTTMHAYAETAQSMAGATLLVSADDVRGQLFADPALQATARTNPDTPERALFQMRIDNELYPRDEEWIPHVLHRERPDGTSYFHQRHDAQNRAVWQLGLSQNIQDIIQRGSIARLFVQGVAMLPEHAAQLREKYPTLRALYLINTNPAHGDTILQIVEQARQTDPSSNWMSSWSNRRVIEYMKMNLALSERRRAEAEAYGFAWRDMGEGDFRENIARNVGYLAYGNPL